MQTENSLAISMNTGISDAFNLGWKLASMINHSAADELIDTYEQERQTLRHARSAFTTHQLLLTRPL